jgi:hypothetical protein
VGPIPSAWAYGALPLFSSSVSGTAGGKIINIIFKLSKDYLNQKGIDVFYLGKILFKKLY